MQLKTTRKFPKFNQFLSNPARVIVLSFALLILAGTLALMLPTASKSGIGLSFPDALFTATSATCVTGLVVVDTFTQFTIGGQLVIMFLIQLGGLGLVTFATFFNILIRKKIGFKSLNLAKESVSSDSLFNIGHLIKMIFTITFCFEALGAAVLMTVFIPEFGSGGIFISIFLAVSAYCNAGFDTLGFMGEYSGLTNFQSNPVVLITIMSLIVCGGLGFIVWQDIYIARKTKKLMVHTKLVLGVTLALIISGAVFGAVLEWNNNKTIGTMGTGDKVLNSVFLSITTRTAGFNSVPTESLLGITKLLCVVLMFIGASPGSTGGGIKVTTFVVVVMTVVSVLRGKDDTIVFKRKVPKAVVYKALAVIFSAMFAVIIAAATIYFSSHSGLKTSEIDSLFEAVSAFGTVGLSVGVTAVANQASRYILILTMFFGRVGPVALALSLAMKNQDKNTIMPEAKIMVG